MQRKCSPSSLSFCRWPDIHLLLVPCRWPDQHMPPMSSRWSLRPHPDTDVQLNFSVLLSCSETLLVVPSATVQLPVPRPASLFLVPRPFFLLLITNSAFLLLTSSTPILSPVLSPAAYSLVLRCRNTWTSKGEIPCIAPGKPNLLNVV